ncbi:MAG: MgtC/SapB family protein [Gemmatimonadaceae bacterium]|jgi:uncharacterized membrane protein (DUF4010 family)|nr:MgtC/SapB family protein [Gemmatimonadaceae bacterium]
MSPADLARLFDLAVAALIGFGVGLEREWSGHTAGPDARFAGIRTCFMLGLVGGVAGTLIREGSTATGSMIVAGASALAVVAYILTVRRPGTSTDGTTEVAALIVIALGVLAGLGQRALASGLGAIVVLALMEKSRLQRWITRIDETELRAALQFAVLALVVLPLLPLRGYGPGGVINPRQLWAIVLLCSGLSFAGYLARTIVGETRGVGLTGILGGLVSSTAVTLAFSRRSRTEPALATALGVGVLGACTVLLPRVLVLAAVISREVMWRLLPILAPAVLVGVGMTVLLLRKGDGAIDRSAAPSEVRNPLNLVQSLQMAVGFQVVLLLLELLRARVGTPGLLATAALLGLTDVDALTLSMSRLGRAPETTALAAQAIGVGILANTLLKFGAATALGASAFRRVASAGLLLFALAIGVGLWLATRRG